MQKFLILTFFIFSNISLAATPTFESLLRNANNPDIEGRTVIAKMSVSKIGSQIDSKDLSFLNQEGLVTEKNITDDMSIQFIINNEREQYPRLTQIDYKGVNFKNPLMKSMKTYSLYNLKSVIPNDEKVEARLFYSVLSILLNNNNKLFLDFINGLGVEYKLNKDLINKEKMALLEEYAKYLQAIKESKGEEVEIKNPLKPEDPELRKAYAKLWKKPLIQEDGIVQRIKISDKFFYIVDLNNLYLKFDSDHKLKELKLKTTTGNISYSFGRYITSRSNSQFPENIYYKGLDGVDYEIKFERMRLPTDTAQSRFRRLKYFKNVIKKNEIDEGVVKPEFIL